MTEKNPRIIRLIRTKEDFNHATNPVIILEYDRVIVSTGLPDEASRLKQRVDELQKSIGVDYTLMISRTNGVAGSQPHDYIDCRRSA